MEQNMSSTNTQTQHRSFADEHGPYQLPNDSLEHDRLDAQYRAFAEVMGGKVFHAPNAPKFPRNPRKIIDIGCGTGVLTVQLARLFPRAQVVGVDLSAVPDQARHAASGQLPPNVTYLQGDVADLLRRGELEAGSFDYVFSRLLLLGIVDWPTHVRDVVVKLLAPGGCAELQEYDSMSREAADGSVTELGAGWDWFTMWLADTEAIGLDLRVGARLRQLFVDAGAAVDPDGETVYNIPHAAPSARGSDTEDEYWTTVVDTYWGVVLKSSGERRSPEELEKMRKSFNETFVFNMKHAFCTLHVVVAFKN